MLGSTIAELFGSILYNFTRDVTEYYNPNEPEFTAESLATILWTVQGENGIVILLMNLFTKNTATEKPQV